MPNHLAERVEGLCRKYFDQQADSTDFKLLLLPVLQEAGYLPFERNQREDTFYVRCDRDGKIVVVSTQDLFKNEIQPAAEVEDRAELSCVVLSAAKEVEELVDDYHNLQKLKTAQESFTEKPDSSFTEYPIVREVINFGREVLPYRMTHFIANSPRFQRYAQLGAVGAAGYVVGAVVGIVATAAMTDSIIAMGAGGLVGNRLGMGTAVGIRLYHRRRDQKNNEELRVEYHQALIQFQEKYGSRAVMGREGLMLAFER
ncbi:MAG: hypothetical protein V2A62_00025 [Candidatus Woesearchaeota archaeon]